jgi:hypothetical protein
MPKLHFPDTAQYRKVRQSMIDDYLDHKMTIQAIANKYEVSYTWTWDTLNSRGKITGQRVK